MATLPHHDAPRRGTKIYLRPQEDARPASRTVSRPDARPSRVQRMAFIFGINTMLWLGIAVLVMVL